MKQILILFICLIYTSTFAQSISTYDLSIENRTNPIGLDVKTPRFTWKIAGTGRNISQTAYSIRVATSPDFARKNIVWDSGKISSDESVLQAYQGQALKSGQKYYWQVKVWDNQSQESPWSTTAFWQTALLNPASEISAQWISSGIKGDSAYGLVPQFRKSFNAGKKIKSAIAYITAKGLYEAHINGQRVGNAYLTPGWTSYNKRLLYQTYDVTGLVKQGKNAIGVSLGNGWYRGELGWEKKTNFYGKQTALICQINITYTDGKTETIVSDGSWKVLTGPLLFAEIYDGEVYDARLEKNNWTTVNYDDKNWQPVEVKDFPKDILLSSNHELITKHETFKPVKVLTTPKGEKVLDFGQNLVGWVQMKVSGSAGDKIVLSHSEVLDKTGGLYFDNLRNALAQDTYILKGQGLETYEPRFTFHGFRYVRVEGLKGELNPENFIAIALYSDMKPTGNFECSNPLVNQLQKNIQWGQKGNFLDVPTDCPQRDERLGWTGDAEVFSRTAAFNFNVNNFFTKWLKDVAADQNPNGSIPFVIPNALKGTFFDNPIGAAGWSDAGIIIPWNMYVVYGDKRVVEEQYASMKAYLQYVRNAAKNDLWNTGFQFADWLSYRVDDSKGMIGQRSAVTDNYLVAQCFFAYNTDLMIKAAKLLGKTEDVKDFEALSARVKAAFQKEFMTSNGRLISETQTAYILALQFDMLPENLRPSAVQRLVDNIKSYNYHLTTGFLGTPFLTPVLTRFGKTDVAYRLLLQDTYPSWLFPIKMGATTVWERWDSMKPDSTFQDPGMTSFNHYAYGAVGDWMYRDVAGIDVDEEGAGYKKIIIRPHLGDGLSSAKATLQTNYGLASSAWRKEAKETVYTIEIPVNTSATVYLPTTNIPDIEEGGKPISSDMKILGIEGAYTKLQVGSGKYEFKVRK